MLVKFTAGARVALGLALATAGAGAVAGETRWTAIAACALAAVAVALLVLARFGRSTGCRGSTRRWARPRPPAWPSPSAQAPPRRSAPAASRAASRSAAGGRAGRCCSRSPGSRRWPPARGAPRSAALALGAAAWIREPPPEPGPEFSPVVLTAILAFATVALTLLTVGQFTEVDDVAIALAA